MNKKIGLAFFSLFFLAFAVAATSISNDLHVNVQVTNSSGHGVAGTYDFVFNISDSSDCSSVVFSDSTTASTDVRGVYDRYLSNVNLNYDKTYWLCYYRDNVLQSSAKIVPSAYAQRALKVNSSAISFDSNLNLSTYDLHASTLYGDLAYSYLTGAPTAVSYFSNDAGYFSSEANITCASISGLSTDLCDGSDADTTYVNGTGLNLTSTTFSILDKYFNNWNAAFSWGDHASEGYITSYENLTETDVDAYVNNNNYLDLDTYPDADTNVKDDVNSSTNFGGEVSGTFDAIVIGNDVLDDQYYDSEDDLTSLLNDNYAMDGANSDITSLSAISGEVKSSSFINFTMSEGNVQTFSNGLCLKVNSTFLGYVSC